jgi:ribosomal protein S18 acetylase RimI-like enzyme
MANAAVRPAAALAYRDRRRAMTTTSGHDDGAAPAAISLRPATEADYDFMRRLYASTREAEMAHFPFGEAQKRAFLDQQFAAQFAHYGLNYPTCERNIVEREGAPVGRLWIDEWRDQIRLVDIALVPECRGLGIGTALLRQVLRRGAAAGKPVTIHVEAYNPALTLYRRLHFEPVDTNGVYVLMRWTPSERDGGHEARPPTPPGGSG